MVMIISYVQKGLTNTLRALKWSVGAIVRLKDEFSEGNRGTKDTMTEREMPMDVYVERYARQRAGRCGPRCIHLEEMAR